MIDRPLKVCHLGKFYPPAPGGIESHVQTLACAQAALGAEVRVICVNHADRQGRNVTWSRTRRTQTVEETDCNVRITRVGRIASFARLDICPDLPRIIGELNRDTVDIVHLQAPNPTMLLAVALMLRSGTPLIISHQSDIVKQRWLRHAVAPFDRLVYGRASLILASSSGYIAGSSQLQRHAAAVRTLPLGIDLQQLLTPSASAQAHAESFRAIYGNPLWLAVGRNVYYKGFHTAIEALARGIAGNLLIIGSGPLESELRAVAQKLGVQDRVFWRAYVDPDELVGAYLAATALWFPSNARSEAYGLVQVEAMAAGCPVINTDIPASGVSWVSRHDETGLTVGVNDSAAFAAAATRLLNDPALRRRLADGAKRRAQAEFDHLLMAQRSLALYRRVSARRLRSLPIVAKRLTTAQWVRSMAELDDCVA